MTYALHHMCHNKKLLIEIPNVLPVFNVILFRVSMLLYISMEHIGRVVGMSVSGYRGRRFER